MILTHQDPPFQKNFSTSSGGDVTDKITEGFRSWLSSKSYSSSTIRNYLSDISSYFNFIENCRLKIENSNPFSSDTISVYLQTIQKNPTYSRYLSSLSKFFQFALDQNIIKTNPLKQAQKVKKPTTDDILNNYQSQLIKKKFSQSTIRNYINDIHQFIDWSKSTSNQNPTYPPSRIEGFKTKKTIKETLTSLFKGRKDPLKKVGLKNKEVSPES